MRLWTSGLLALTLLAGSIAVTSAAPHKAAKASHLVYLCPESGVGADHAAACPVCKKPMGRVATYACMKCQISSDAPGPWDDLDRLRRERGAVQRALRADEGARLQVIRRGELALVPDRGLARVDGHRTLTRYHGVDLARRGALDDSGDRRLDLGRRRL